MWRCKSDCSVLCYSRHMRGAPWSKLSDPMAARGPRLLDGGEFAAAIFRLTPGGVSVTGTFRVKDLET